MLLICLFSSLKPAYAVMYNGLKGYFLGRAFIETPTVFVQAGKAVAILHKSVGLT